MLIQKTKHLPRRIYGIDFSGAKDAGRKIWITRGLVKRDGLQIEDCSRASDFFHAGKERDRCLTALREFMAGQKDCAFGLDFPFGLPRKLLNEKSWEDFIMRFPLRHKSPSGFRTKCREAVYGRELKRVADEESKTPFSPYNLRVYRQTYFGVRDVIHPLVRDQKACVLPMQTALIGKPWVLEICPASTLKKMSLYDSPYKGRTEAHRRSRKKILEAIEKKNIIITEQALRDAIIKDRGGDALDSVIAAYETFKSIPNPAILSHGAYRAYLLEGYVFC